MLKTFLKTFLFTSLALIAVVIILEGSKSTHSNALKRQKVEHTVITEKISTQKKVRKERAGFFSRTFFIDYPIRLSYSISNFIRKLSLKPTPSLKLTEINISPDIEKFSFLIEGSIRSFNIKGALPKLLNFYSYIDSFENILYLSHSEPEVVKNNNSERMQKDFRFTISGEVETE
ncbi:MAG: hypothetical protein ABFR75_13995 [Acidobacteriota bacterium]